MAPRKDKAEKGDRSEKTEKISTSQAVDMVLTYLRKSYHSLPFDVILITKCRQREVSALLNYSTHAWTDMSLLANSRPYSVRVTCHFFCFTEVLIKAGC